MVECEFFFTIKRLSVIKVLIDTWWNVNMLYANETRAENSVLIDTWWNVNVYRSRMEFGGYLF